MKRRREMDEVEGQLQRSVIRSAIEEITTMMVNVKVKPLQVIEANPASGGGGGDDEQVGGCVYVPTRPFLSICYLVLQILDKIGPTMAVLRQDINQNIQRIEKMYEVDPSVYSNLVEMLKKETSEGIAKKGHSFCKAFVWLTRSLDFTTALLQRLKDPEQNNMEKMVQESYNITLKPWHGWIASAAFKVALKLVPDKKTFIDLLTDKAYNNDTLKQDMQTLISSLLSCLQDIHSILTFYGLDRLKST